MLRDEVSFLDSERWSELAHDVGIRLPQWRTPCTTGKMKWYLQKVGTSLNWYLEYHNAKSLKQFVQMNPDWPLRAWLGVQLEIIDWEKNHECPSLTSNPLSGPASAQQSKRVTTKTSSSTSV